MDKRFEVYGAEEVIQAVARDLADSATAFGEASEIIDKSKDGVECIEDLEKAMDRMQEAISYYRKVIQKSKRGANP